jgi:hypothetical protein
MSHETVFANKIVILESDGQPDPEEVLRPEDIRYLHRLGLATAERRLESIEVSYDGFKAIITLDYQGCQYDSVDGMLVSVLAQRGERQVEFDFFLDENRLTLLGLEFGSTYRSAGFQS